MGKAGSRVLPDVACAPNDLGAFRAHPLVDFSAADLPVLPSLAPIEVEGKIRNRRLFKDPEEPGSLSWLAGALAFEWPVDEEAQPLAHIMQVDLGNAAENFGGPTNVLDDIGLPKAGVVQLFHDLRTYGWEAQQEQVSGWHVPWISSLIAS